MKLIIRINTPIKVNGEQLETGTATMLDYGFDKHLILKGENTYLMCNRTYEHLVKEEKISVL